MAKWTLLANRVGYLVLALAMALFVIAFAVGFTSTMAGLIIASLLISFALLAPSIVLGARRANERISSTAVDAIADRRMVRSVHPFVTLQ